MGDHFVFLVDHLLTESTLEAAIQSRNPKQAVRSAVEEDTRRACLDSVAGMPLRKIVECRICQDEDLASNMETPCSCCGSLKYAHRDCVQRWCNEKGDTVCEICRQNFQPCYTAPPPQFRPRNLPTSSRGNWGIITRRELSNRHLVAVVPSDQNFSNSAYDDYAISSSRSISCCRSIAIICVILLVLRHTLPIIVSQEGDYSSPLVMLLLLRIAGIVLPVYILFKAATSYLHHIYHQASMPISPDEEAGYY
ncbi:unnamed protein product [Cuscuta epithymum]|uniref:RING-CH-type domain-containing protein n=1 Tax=Cuscuta epithymum TaxID=186058 RepID=A0AAV0C194_9ASTE|nr:unnamed protein product [Cuscuta epithymum]